MPTRVTAEHRRLADSEARRADRKKWGPYVSEPAWGTIREDYSATGEAWDYFPHDHARSRAYRWNEDGLAGVSNRFQNLCLAVGLWNERDPILKERLFGLTSNEGNYGEDVKEYYFYLDSTPTQSYMKMLYKYPQVEYPCAQLAADYGRRGRGAPEFELMDALRDAFQAGRYFDVFVEYAKAGQEDILCRITAVNRGPEPRPSTCCPTCGTATTGRGHGRARPELRATGPGAVHTVLAESDKTIVVEGNHYFPVDSLNPEYLQASNAHTTCPWRGQASYYSVKVNGEVNRDAAWYYPNPKSAAAQIKDYVAFWRGVKVED